MKNVLVFLVALVVCHPAYPAELFGSVDAISGTAFVSEKSGKSSGISMGQKIYEGQTINTASDGEVHLITEDGGVIALRPDTIFRVDEYKAEGDSTDKIFMSLFKGAVRSITGWIGKHNTSAYRITTPTATIGIRGTDHETTVIENAGGDEPGTYDTVNEGATLLKTPQGQTEVTPGKFAFVPRNRVIAPYILTKQPNYWAKRRLKIESRIQQRKDFFHNRMERMREDRIKHMESIRGKRANDQRGGHLSNREHGQMAARNNKLREHRSGQAMQHREARRMEIEQHRHEIREKPVHTQNGM